MRTPLYEAAMLVAAAMSVGIVSAQNAPAPKPHSTKSSQPPKLSADEKLARGMLDSASAQVRSLPSPMRSYLSCRIAEGYSRYGKKKERSELQRAFLAAIEATQQEGANRGMEFQSHALTTLLLDFGPKSVEELLPQADDRLRQQLAGNLAQIYLEHHQIDKAVQTLESVPPGDLFPYLQATEVMEQLPPERNSDLLALFSRSLDAYTQSKRALPDPLTDVGQMIVRFQKRLPAAVILQAIDDVLQTDSARSDRQKIRYSLAYDSGTVSFDDFYQFRLFQFLPILRELDATEADSLLQANPSFRSKLDQYPQGLQSLDPSLNDSKPRLGISPAFRGAIMGGQNNSDFEAQMEANRQMEKVVDSAATNADLAITNAQLLPAAQQAQALVQIAHKVCEQDPTSAKKALEKLASALASARPQEAAHFYSRAAEIYLTMQDTEAAKSAVASGLEQVSDIYKEDTDHDDPNQELEVFWPSTLAFSSFVQRSAKISTAAALKLIEAAPDDEMRLTLKINLADSLLKAPVVLNEHPRERHKSRRIDPALYFDDEE